MIETRTYANLAAITFRLDRFDVLKLLKDAGKIPEGFDLESPDLGDTEWPIDLKIVSITPETEGGKP